VVVHEQSSEFGGTERVLAAVLRRWPDAITVAPRFSGEGSSPVMDGPTRPIPLRGRRNHFLGPLYARRLAGQSLAPADLVLSLPGSGWALAASAPPGVPHVAYTAGLPRALYGQMASYLPGYPAPLRPVIQAAAPVLRAHHRRLVRRPMRLLTNSSFSATGLRRACGVEAGVLYPPVRTDFFTPAPAPLAREHFLMVARLGPQKLVDSVVEAFRSLPGERLVVAGTGRRLAQLRASAPPNVDFTGFVSERRLRELYRSAHALLCPSIEEFGIVVAEALACGTPAVARAEGGSAEIVRHGETGLLLRGGAPGGLAAAVAEIRAREWDAARCREVAERFDEEGFVAGLEQELEQQLGERAGASRLSSAVA
jgi:glycosyltransferase involved in cell wall biosynthesis